MLSDIVRVIRTFRPDIIITRFPPEPGGTHGHHTASSALALEAFKLGGDPKAFPEQLKTLTPWQPKRILWNGYGAYPGAPAENPSDLKIDIDGTDAVTGASFAVLAAKSRSMHRTQGFANFSVAAGGNGPRVESFHLLDGEPGAEGHHGRGRHDLGPNSRRGQDRASGRRRASTISTPRIPRASVPALLQMKALLAKLPADPVVAEKGRQLDRILQSCLGLSVADYDADARGHPRRDDAPERHRRPPLEHSGPMERSRQAPGSPTPFTRASRLSARRAPFFPRTRRSANPTGFARPGRLGCSAWTIPSLIGLPQDFPPISIRYVFEVGGQTLVVEDEAVEVTADPPKGEIRRSVDVIPPVSLRFPANVQLFAPGSGHAVEVEVVSSRAGSSGTVSLETPAGWTASPKGQELSPGGGRGQRLGSPSRSRRRSATGIGSIAAQATSAACSYGSQRIEINYPHIPPQLLQPPARMKAVSLDLAIRGKSIGYLPGAGDSVAASLEQMGYQVTQLTDADLTAENLGKYDAVVIGVRAFNTRTELPAHLPGLFAYVEAGGTVVEQYNTPGGLQTPQLAPYDLKLNRDLPHYRVTDEKARGDSPRSRERRVHDAQQDRRRPTSRAGCRSAGSISRASGTRRTSTPLLSASDVGEAPLKGGLLVAHYGKGIFVYTGLSFFRQLPAGVPGAYRLFANLVSLGK